MGKRVERCLPQKANKKACSNEEARKASAMQKLGKLAAMQKLGKLAAMQKFTFCASLFWISWSIGSRAIPESSLEIALEIEACRDIGPGLPIGSTRVSDVTGQCCDTSERPSSVESFFCPSANRSSPKVRGGEEGVEKSREGVDGAWSSDIEMEPASVDFRRWEMLGLAEARKLIVCLTDSSLLSLSFDAS